MDYYSQDFPHPSFSPIRICPIQEEDGELIVLSERIYEFFDQSLPDYVNSLGGQIQTEWDEYNANEEMFKIIKPEIKVIIRSMISLVLYMHSKELTFSRKLDYSTNFGVSGGVLKFWRISFSPSTRHKDRRENFKQIGRIIKNDVLHDTEDPLPEYLEHLCELMVSNFSEYKIGNQDSLVAIEEFFQMHISLMSSEERLRFIMNCHNKVDVLTTTEYTSFTSAVLEMGDNTNWVDRLGDSFSVLYTSVLHGILKADRPEISVSEAKELIDQLDIPEYLVRVRQRYRDVDRNTFLINKDILSVCRNVVTHSYGVPKEVKVNYKRGGEEVEIDAAIMKTFGDLLLHLQIVV